MRKRNRQSTRLRTWDYSFNGYYFVTICTHGRLPLFGNITNGFMNKNNIGKMVNTWWQKLPNKFNNVYLDEYQLMPNHIHVIIIINSVGAPVPVVGAHPRVRPEYKRVRPHKSNGQQEPINGQTHGSAPTTDVESTTLGTIIQWFKTMTTNKYIELVKQNTVPAFEKRIWQRNYHDRVIRNKLELLKIRDYIDLNPLKWERDRNNPKNMKFVNQHG